MLFLPGRQEGKTVRNCEKTACAGVKKSNANFTRMRVILRNTEMAAKKRSY